MNRNDTQSLKEALSALADSELSENTEMTEAELIERVCDDHDAMLSWQCAHLTRDVLQADYTAALGPDFAARVRNQIAAEESVSVDAADYYPESGQVVSMADARQRSAHRRSSGAMRSAASTSQNEPFKLWKPVAGLGLAASLAGATLLFSQLSQTDQPGGSLVAELPDSTTELQQTVALQDSGAQSTDVQSLQAAVPMENGGTRWRMDSDLPRNEQIEQRLNTLLTNHLEDASMGRITGMMSHSRVVGYDSMRDDEQ